MKLHSHLLAGMLCAGILLVGPGIKADEGATAGRDILAKNQNAVVTVKLVIKQGVSFAGRDANKRESKSETTGTVIDASGLTLISLSETDPSSLLGNMIGGGDEESGKIKFESEVSDVKIVMPDGTEIPAKVVLRDKDLDMAFVRPIDKPAKPFAYADLAQDSKPKILEPLIILNRMGKVANRVPSVSVDRVEAVVEKPRTFYIPGRGSSSGGLGSPAYTFDGKLVGVVLLRSIKSEGGLDVSSLLSSGSGGMGILPVILPSSDIADAAKQAPEVEKVKPAASKEAPKTK